MRNARPGLSRWTVSVPALAFVAVLSATRALLAAAAPPARTWWQDWASTSVVNLLLHPVGAMMASVFVGSGDLVLWCMLGALGLVTTAWRFGGWQTVLLTGAAHTIGTYLSEGLLAVRVLMHELPASNLQIEDLGPSYVVVSALCVGIVFGPTVGRLGCAVGFLSIAPELFEGLTGLDMTAVGHLCAILTGVTLAFALRHHQQRTDPQWTPAVGP